MLILKNFIKLIVNNVFLKYKKIFNENVFEYVERNIFYFKRKGIKFWVQEIRVKLNLFFEVFDKRDELVLRREIKMDRKRFFVQFSKWISQFVDVKYI